MINMAVVMREKLTLGLRLQSGHTKGSVIFIFKPMYRSKLTNSARNGKLLPLVAGFSL